MRIGLFLSLLAFLVVGCDSTPKPPEKGPISGKLTIDGKPAPMANIRFISLESHATNGLGKVKDGAYSLPKEQGLSKGKYRIEFSVPSTLTTKMKNPDNPLEWMEVPNETLPDKFHKNSDYLIEYDPSGKTTYDWDLKTK